MLYFTHNTFCIILLLTHERQRGQICTLRWGYHSLIPSFIGKHYWYHNSYGVSHAHSFWLIFWYNIMSGPIVPSNQKILFLVLTCLDPSPQNYYLNVIIPLALFIFILYMD